jgi:hypothetical protein
VKGAHQRKELSWFFDSIKQAEFLFDDWKVFAEPGDGFQKHTDAAPQSVSTPNG